MLQTLNHPAEDLITLRLHCDILYNIVFFTSLIMQKMVIFPARYRFSTISLQFSCTDNKVSNPLCSGLLDLPQFFEWLQMFLCHFLLTDMKVLATNL